MGLGQEEGLVAVRNETSRCETVMFLEINTMASRPGSSSVCPGPTLTNSRSQQPIMQAPKSQSNGGICPKSLRPPPFGRYFLFLEQHCTMSTSSTPHWKMGLCENIYLVTTSVTSCVRWYGCIFSMLISGLEISSSRLHYSIHFLWNVFASFHHQPAH